MVVSSAELTQGADEIVDLGAGVGLGDTEQHVVLEGRIVLAEVVAADDVALVEEEVVDLGDGARAGDDELLEEGARGDDAEARERADEVGGVVALVPAELASRARRPGAGRACRGC